MILSKIIQLRVQLKGSYDGFMPASAATHPSNRISCQWLPVCFYPRQHSESMIYTSQALLLEGQSDWRLWWSGPASCVLPPFMSSCFNTGPCFACLERSCSKRIKSAIRIKRYVVLAAMKKTHSERHKQSDTMFAYFEL